MMRPEILAILLALGGVTFLLIVGAIGKFFGIEGNYLTMAGAIMGAGIVRIYIKQRWP